MGIYLSDQERDCLTNLRFADDVMLFATSKEQIRNMMYEFKKAAEKVGLRIHPDKTKILSNQSNMKSDTKRFSKVGEMSIEILTKNESVKYLGQRISFHQQETLEIKSRIRAVWATFHKLCCAAGTWTLSKEHERMIQSTQRKMLRLIIQTKRKYKNMEKQDIEPKDEKGIVEKTENCSTDDESGDGQSTKSKDDVDSGVTFDEDSEKEIDTIEIEEEDWIDHIKRSTTDMIRCWNRTHKKMKWKLALRIATSPSAEWNPELSSRYKTNRAIGRPRKRWEDDINDFLKQNLDEKENEEPPERKIQNKNIWINTAKDWNECARLEEKYTMKSVK